MQIKNKCLFSYGVQHLSAVWAVDRKILSPSQRKPGINYVVPTKPPSKPSKFASNLCVHRDTQAENDGVAQTYPAHVPAWLVQLRAAECLLIQNHMFPRIRRYLYNRFWLATAAVNAWDANHTPHGRLLHFLAVYKLLYRWRKNDITEPRYAEDGSHPALPQQFSHDSGKTPMPCNLELAACM